MNEMLPESTRCVTGSAVNMGGEKRLLLSEGWRDYSRTRWSYRSDDGRPVTLLGKFTDKNLIPVHTCVDQSSFQAQSMKERRKSKRKDMERSI